MLLAAAGSATAAPFATTYTGTVASSGFATVAAGQPYSVTLVFDNGGSTAAGQTWQAAHLTCVLWRFNMAHNAVYAQDLVAVPPTAVAGAATTDARGALVGMFAGVSMHSSTAYSAHGFAPALASVAWSINGINNPFMSLASAAAINGAAGGVPVDPARWSAPVPFPGPCAGRRAAVNSARPVALPSNYQG